MRFISWNVNGFRAVLTKGFEDYFKSIDADIFCIQETKMQQGQAEFAPEGYFCYWFSAQKKGYSGTAIFSKIEPLSVSYGLGEKHIDEGRVITLEFENFYFVGAYVPNAQRELARLDYRMEFEDDMREYLSTLDKTKPVVYCGDLNVAHNEIDLKNPKSNIGNAGFSYEERGKMTELLDAGFTDTFRYLHPTEEKYSWWSYMFHAREKNVGWRIDYFIISDSLRDKLVNADIHTDVMGSDHCPVEVVLEL
ncbi:MAG: exodeoxyribonuclease III [Clostridiales bacterium]|nr:exodeoxyribonuclease III [Clostridiales bacterium]